MKLTYHSRLDDWLVVRFDEIAKNIVEYVIPDDEKLMFCVRMKDLDLGRLRISRKDVLTDMKSKQLLVKSGQIIFCPPSTGQPETCRVAVSNFTGICSSRAFILEPISKVIEPYYLPFFMLSDIFVNRIIGIPGKVTWKSLASQEFLIPPRQRQMEIVKMLNAVQRSLEFGDDALQAVLDLKKVMLSKLFDSAACV